MVSTYSVVEPTGQGWQIATINGRWCGRLPRTREHNNTVLLPAWFDAGLQPDDVSGCPAYMAGKLILRDVTEPISIPAGKKRGANLEQPIVDTQARTATWYTLVDKDAADLAADLDARKASMKAAAATRRWEVETGGIVRNGVPIATDQVTQSKIGGALQLVQDDPQIVVRWKGPAGWINLDAAAVTYTARETGLHVQAAFAREAEIDAALDEAADPSALDLIDIENGTIDGNGAWPS